MDNSLIQGLWPDLESTLKFVKKIKIEVGISSNLLHSISTSIYIRKCNKKLGVIFWPFFGKKPWAIVQGFFQILDPFLKWL